MKDKLEKWKNKKFNDVYLLGAGASLAYGYPLGSVLKTEILDLASGKDQIFNSLKNNIDADKRADIQHELGEFSKEFDKFIDAFKKSGAQTIDSFVHRNKAFSDIARLLVGYVLICKSRIAKNIIDGASSGRVNNCEPWIHNYLNKSVGTNYLPYLKEPDCFISFNYDLSLEEHFFNYFSQQQIDSTVSANANRIVYEELPIFHIYGKLQNLKPVLKSLSKSEPPEVHDLLNASKDINFIDRTHKEEYETLRGIIQNAKRLIVLGYGFDPDNNQVLFGGLKVFQDDFITLKIISTSKGLSDSEVKKFKELKYSEDVLRSLERISANYETEMYDKDCNQFLMDHILVRNFFNDEK